MKSRTLQSPADDMDREARVLATFWHPNVVQYFGRVINAAGAEPGIFLEAMLGDIDQYLAR